MVKIKLQKNGYNTFALWGPLAIETYCDINKISDEEKIVINKMYQKQKEYNDISREKIKKRDELVEDVLKIVEMLGADKFTIYDDGNVEYNDENKEKGGNE